MPYLLRSSPIPSTAFLIAAAHWACVHPVFGNFSAIMNSVSFSETHAKQNPRAPPTPCQRFRCIDQKRERKTGNVAAAAARRTQGRENWAAGHQGGVQGRLGECRMSMFRWLQNVCMPRQLRLGARTFTCMLRMLQSEITHNFQFTGIQFVAGWLRFVSAKVARSLTKVECKKQFDNIKPRLAVPNVCVCVSEGLFFFPRKAPSRHAFPHLLLLIYLA